MKRAIEEIIMTCKNALDRSESNLAQDEARVYRAAIEFLEELKAYCTAQRPDWVPHPKIEPEDGQEVLVQMHDGHITGGTYDDDNPAGFFDDHGEWIMGDDVVAWMPLPEPPEVV